ncbi:MAG TPA: MDR family MFS transporter [Rubrobacter sp.]|nr:MDR family MFS transporter [Rubrobacter sp.]
MSANVSEVQQSGRRETVLAVAGLMLALFLVALDQTVVGTALPKIIADLNGFEHYAWVTTAYLLASTAMIPVIGKLGDIYGRKWFIISGVVIFLAASALCGAAWGMTELILFRGLQGLGAGMIFSNIFTSVADIFPDPARRAKYQGVFFSVFALTSVIGPTMGGWITDNLSWRWVFYINLPLGVFSLFALPVVLHQSARRYGVKIDYLGAATITASVVSLLLALSWVGEGYDWDATRVVIGFVVAGILFAAFIPVELRATEPIIPLSLFKSRVFGSAALLMFMVGIGMFGIILYTPLFVQGVLGKTATGSGTVLTPLVLSMTAMGVICGQIIARVKRTKPFMIAGAIVMTFGVYLLTTLDVDSTQRTVALYLMITGLGLGPLMPSATLSVQSTVEKRLLGVATSATQFIRSLGSTVGTAVIGSLVTSGYADYLNDNAPPQAPGRLIKALEDPNALVSEQARNALDRVASAFPGGEQLVAQILQVSRHGLSNSLHDGFVFTLVAVSGAIVAALFMKNIRLGDQGQPAVPAPAASLERDRLLTGITLEYLARRIEGANGDSRNLISAASRLVPDAEGSERERARVAVDRVLRPLALEAIGTSVERNGANGHSENGHSPNGQAEEHVRPIDGRAGKPERSEQP